MPASAVRARCLTSVLIAAARLLGRPAPGRARGAAPDAAVLQGFTFRPS